MTTDRTAAVVYWRPGCPFCSRLLGELDRMGLVLDKVNIWEDTAAAARVRSIARGNETVPTVVIGSTALVNPRAAEVLDVARREAPGLLAGLDTRQAERVVEGRWWSGLLITVVFAVVWFIMATRNPATTYHLAPAVVALAWPVARRLRAARPLAVIAALSATAGSALIATTVTVLLQVRGALSGPALLGVSTLTESVIGIAVGAVAGAGLALAGRRKSTA